MTSRPGKKSKRTHEAHIYMTEEEYEAVAARAKSELRSVNGQILFFIRQGLAPHPDSTSAAVSAGMREGGP